ncbi:MAG: response regulator [Nitrospirae bacterium]|nr:response regulator [Nitrospirota bacterium]
MNITDQLLEYSKELSVLYVEDDDVVRETTSKILSRFFDALISVANGKEGVDAYKSANFDIVIADIYMPVMNGIKMTKQIREINSEQVIIITTAYNDYQYLLELISIGINYFILKPLEPAKLMDVLYRACKKIHNERYIEDCYKNLEDVLTRQTVELATTKEQLQIEIKRREQIEEQLRVSMIEGDDIFKRVCVAFQYAIIIIADSGEITFWNKAAEEMFGYTQEEAIGKELHRLITPQRDYQQHIEAYEYFKQTGQGDFFGKTIELEAVRKDGREFPVELSVSAVNIYDKRQAVGIVRDKAVRKQNVRKIKRKHNLPDS